MTTSKPALVLIPGLLCTRALFEAQIEALAPLADVTVADHTGHDSMAAIAGAILAAAPPRFALCGLSMGGYITFEILRQARERVERLALLDTNARADTPELSANRRRLMAKADAEGIAATSDEMWPNWIHADRRAEAELVATVRKMAADTGVAAFKRQQMAIMGRPDSRPELGEIKVPALILVGREDAATPVLQAAEMSNGIPHARMQIVENCGHLSTLERPHTVTSALANWLKAAG
jgi:pimeloyl-ACP methyl ester carboxylesterase